MQIKKQCAILSDMYNMCLWICACLRELSLTEFDWSVHPEQYIVTLDVSVDDLVGMKKLQSLDDLDAEREDG